MIVLKIITYAASVVAQNKKKRARVLGREVVRKVSDIHLQPAF